MYFNYSAASIIFVYTWLLDKCYRAIVILVQPSWSTKLWIVRHKKGNTVLAKSDT